MNQVWETKKLGEVIKLEYGKPLDKSKREATGLYPVYGANGEKARSNEYYFNKKSIIVGRKGSAGEINITAEKFWPLDVTYFVTFDERKYNLKFLFHLLSALNLPKLAKGVKPGINRNDVYSLDVSLPPLPEQKRIVKILDKAFAAIEKAKANTEKNLQNSRELFDSYLNNIFANPGEDWEEKSLDNVCIVERGSSPRPIKKYLTTEANGVNWIKIGDTKGITKYISETKEKITPEGSKKSRYVKEDDFILSNSMSFGKPYIMKTSGYIHDGWFVLRLKDYIDTDFFYYLLISPFVQNQFTILSSGAIVKNISSDLVKKAILPIPTLNEQKKIAKIIEEQVSEIKKLETIYQQKLKDLEELKKSILQKAFNGELETIKAVAV